MPLETKSPKSTTLGGPDGEVHGDPAGDPSGRRSGGPLKLLKPVLAAALIGYLFYSGRLSINPFQDLDSGNGLLLVGLAGLLVLAAYVLSSFRLYLLLGDQGLKTPWRLCLGSTLIGFFFNNFLPTSFGGDTVKAFYLTRSRRGFRARIVGTMVYDRLLGLAGLAGLAGASQIAIRQGLLDLVWEGEVAWVLTLLTGAILSGLVLLRVLSTARLRRWSGGLLERFRQGGPVHRLLSQVADHGQNPRITLAGLGISVVHHLLSGTALYLVYLALGGRAGAASIIALAPQVSLAGVIPLTPGNLGLIEYIGSLVWSAQEMARGGDIWLTFRVVTALFSLTGAVAYLRLRPQGGSRTEGTG